MKHLSVLIIAFILGISTIFTVPFSHAAASIKKDTSWFDHNDPKQSYKISTEAQLMGLSSLVNEEQTDHWKPTRVEKFEGVTFTLTRDIELTQPWIPIGIDDSAYFAGVFDGNGHTISNMNVGNHISQSGFFGYLVGEVRNLNIEGTNNSNSSNTGGIAGTVSSTGRIINCVSDVKVKGTEKTGGIAGNNQEGHIEGCINLGTVSGTHKVGGIVGENWGGTITKCGNRGEIKSIRRGVATYGTGGVAGRSVSAEAEISECYNAEKINSNTEATGGVVGYINARGSTVKDCYNTGTINITIKSSDSEISPSYAGGVVGIAGVNGVVIRNCYSTGIISNADVSAGVIGAYHNETEEKIRERFIKNNYYVSGSFHSGIGFIEYTKDDNLDKAVKGISNSGMHNLMTSLSVAYAKDTGAYDNNGYPILRWQQPLSTMKKVYFDNIPIEIQKRLDKYIIDSADETRAGQILIDILTPSNQTSNAFILYMEAQDKIEEIKKKEAENNGQ